MSAARKHPPERWEALTEDQRQALTVIALEAMRVQTLETRRSDSLDFPEVSVWAIREALARAFLAGRNRTRRQ
jgi:hypothetical protein